MHYFFHWVPVLVQMYPSSCPHYYSPAGYNTHVQQAHHRNLRLFPFCVQNGLSHINLPFSVYLFHLPFSASPVPLTISFPSCFLPNLKYHRTAEGWRSLCSVSVRPSEFRVSFACSTSPNRSDLFDRWITSTTHVILTISSNNCLVFLSPRNHLTTNTGRRRTRKPRFGRPRQKNGTTREGLIRMG